MTMVFVRTLLTHQLLGQTKTFKAQVFFFLVCHV